MSKPLSFSQTRVVLASYAPLALDPARWSSLRRSVIDTVAKAKPISADHASQLASTLTRFLAEQPDLDKMGMAVVTEARVAAWEYTTRATGTPNTSRRLASQMHRIVRAVDNLPVRTHASRGSTSKNAPGLVPMSDVELAAATGGDPVGWLTDHAGNARSELWRQVRLTLDVRLVVKEGAVSAIRAGLGRRRLEEAAPFVPVPSDVASLLRGA